MYLLTPPFVQNQCIWCWLLRSCGPHGLETPFDNWPSPGQHRRTALSWQELVFWIVRKSWTSSSAVSSTSLADNSTSRAAMILQRYGCFGQERYQLHKIDTPKLRGKVREAIKWAMRTARDVLPASDLAAECCARYRSPHDVESYDSNWFFAAMLRGRKTKNQ